MKSSQSKATQTPSSSDTSSVPSARNRDESATSRRDQQNEFSVAGTDVPSSSSAQLRGRNEFPNLQDQQTQYGMENYAGTENYNPQQQAFGQQQASSQQQGGYSNYSQQDSAQFRRQPNQQYGASQTENIGQSGISALVDAWTGLMLGQVQIATQAAIRLAQCWFSPSLISGISEVQRRYAEDSISSATAAASRLAQFTPRALNQNLDQQYGRQQQEQGQGQQPQPQSRQQYYG